MSLECAIFDSVEITLSISEFSFFFHYKITTVPFDKRTCREAAVVMRSRGVRICKSHGSSELFIKPQENTRALIQLQSNAELHQVRRGELE